MYCVAAKLKKVVGLAVRLVRVYGESIENEDFPKPGLLLAFKTRSKLADGERDKNLKSISLHHLIREGDSPDAVLIRLIDGAILRRMHRLRNEEPIQKDDLSDIDIPEDDLRDYRLAIARREKQLLSGAHIILCTCTTSSAFRIRDASNIQQVS